MTETFQISEDLLVHDLVRNADGSYALGERFASSNPSLVILDMILADGGSLDNYSQEELDALYARKEYWDEIRGGE